MSAVIAIDSSRRPRPHRDSTQNGTNDRGCISDHIDHRRPDIEPVFLGQNPGSESILDERNDANNQHITVASIAFGAINRAPASYSR